MRGEIVVIAMHERTEYLETDGLGGFASPAPVLRTGAGDLAVA